MSILKNCAGLASAAALLAIASLASAAAAGDEQRGTGLYFQAQAREHDSQRSVTGTTRHLSPELAHHQGHTPEA